MLYPDNMLRMIEDERRREIDAIARARLVRSPGRRRAPGVARRNAGRLIVRFGVWLLLLGAPSSVDDADSAA